MTRIAGGIAGNVIPDRVECGAQLPLRARAARRRRREARLAELCGGHGELEVLGQRAERRRRGVAPATSGG